ncbi:MAG: hypothetical protein JO051_10255 [Acidobacteriaceae bacterium]|nr:hypothetical protein [Acidobacteriaceae bacterium]
MQSAPPKIIEKTVSLLLPPAGREEVLGDLYESCTTSGEYIREALSVVPMVILSRIRRTADAQVLLMQGTILYLSFMGAAWYEGKTSLFDDAGFVKLAIPAAWVLFGVVIDDAYCSPGKKSVLKQVRGPVAGLGLAYLSQAVLAIGCQRLALAPWILFYGSAVGLLCSIAVRCLFPAVTDRQVGAGGPALWLKHTAEPVRIASEGLLIVRSLALVLLVAFVGGEVGGPVLSTSLVFISILLLIVRELRRRW